MQHGLICLVSKDSSFSCNNLAAALLEDYFGGEKPVENKALGSWKSMYRRERKKQPTWLFESGENGLSAGVLRICELHHAVVISLVEAKHSIGVICFCKGGADKW